METRSRGALREIFIEVVGAGQQSVPGRGGISAASQGCERHWPGVGRTGEGKTLQARNTTFIQQNADGSRLTTRKLL
ncbi:hypothetical protein NDU88_007963 [Pleurodeles waltl]|uniref:Uncharacterized protein n=1 Tax=Pleurodeles waltl TaxID=8319 RepID=A0AAV7U4S8_PLEWA|nr:hypothetical protein NDU88_007963 [Pleurodeles waltl]